MNRRELLESLIQLDAPLDEILSSLGQFDWDSDELVTLDRAHIISILQRYLNKELASEIVNEWADQIHVRDDVGFKNEDRNLLRDVLHELANPYLTRPLSEATARELLARLLTGC